MGKLNVIGIIPARGGSKRVPLKNIAEIAGKPLIYYTIKEAKKAKTLDRIIVSTDHDGIAEVAKKNGAEVPFKRPADISEDVPTEFVLQHAVKYLEEKEGYPVDVVVTLQPTSPLLKAEYIDACVEKLISNSNIGSVVTVCKITERPEWMFKTDGSKLVPFMDLDLKGDILVSQNLPDLYRHNGAVYATKRDVVMNENRIISKDCIGVVMPVEESYEIEEPRDLKFVDFIIRQPVTNVNKVNINNRSIGDGEPVFIIAEAGINHNGDMEKAKALIDAAAKAGADAIKFQTHLPEEEMLNLEVTAGYVGESLFGLLKRMELSRDNHVELMNYAKERGIMFLSTPFSRAAADMLDGLGVPAFKIGSGEATNIPLLVHIAKKGKPMIISTGMTELEEIEESINAVRKYNNQIILNQCTSTYPTKYEDVRLKAIPIMKEKFGVPTGLSDHSEGIYTALAAVTLGACMIEKHFTISRDWPGPDQKASIEPHELAELVKGVRAIEKTMKSSEKKVIADEVPVQKMARESVVSIKDIPEGSVITEEMVWVKRPGTGIPAKYFHNVVGKRARMTIKSDSLISWEDLL